MLLPRHILRVILSCLDFDNSKNLIDIGLCTIESLQCLKIKSQLLIVLPK